MSVIFEEHEFTDAEFNAYNTFQEANGLWAIWSIYGIKLDDPSFFNVGDVIRNQCDYYGYNVQSVVEGTGKWSDVYKACNRVIVDSGDHDHAFIEGFRRLEDGSLKVITGS